MPEWLATAPPYVVLVFLVIAFLRAQSKQGELNRELFREIHGESIEVIRENTRHHQRSTTALTRLETILEKHP